MTKKKPKHLHKQNGRPPKVDALIISKLEMAFSLGCSDLEACALADISHETLYKYQRDNPEFTERKRRLKAKPVLKARTSVVNALDDDPELSLKFLERKRKKEFGTRQSLDVKTTIKNDGETQKELLGEIEKLINGGTKGVEEEADKA